MDPQLDPADARRLRHDAHAAKTWRSFLKELGREPALPADAAERAAVTVLGVLEQRIFPESSRALEAQLPSRLREKLGHGNGPQQRFGRHELLRRVGAALGCSPGDAEPIVRAVFRAVRATISDGEAAHVAAELPPAIAELWLHPTTPAPPGEPAYFRLVASRHSVRAFSGAPVDADDVGAVLDAMNRAPSAGDLQSYEVVIVSDARRREALARAAEEDWLAAAPLVLAFFAHPARARSTYGARGERLYACQDATIAAAYAQLAAHARGLGAVWVGAFDDAEVARAVDAPAELSPVALIAIGHPAETPERTPRRALDDLARRDSFAHR